MRIRLKSCDLMELARMYRAEAAADRRHADGISHTTYAESHIDLAIRKTQRAEKLEALARRGEEFVLVPVAPFNGGPPSLKVVGGRPRPATNFGLPTSTKRRA